MKHELFCLLSETGALCTGKVRVRVFKDDRLEAGCALAPREGARNLMRVSLLDFDAWVQAAGWWHILCKAHC